MHDKNTEAATNRRAVRESMAKRIAEILVHDPVLWIESSVYDIRNFPSGRKHFAKKTTRTLAGIPVKSGLYVSGQGTFFRIDNDPFGLFYEHVDVSRLTDAALEDFLRTYDNKLLRRR